MHSSNPGYLILLVVFAIGACFFALGTWLVRRESAAARATATPQPPRQEAAEYPSRELLAVVAQPAGDAWARELGGFNGPVDEPTRMDMIERLAIVGQPWCVLALVQARAEDDDAQIREAADAALLVIGARG